MRKKVVILGATGSIGRQALQVISGYPEHLELYGVAATGRDVEALCQLVKTHGAQYVAVTQTEAYRALRAQLPSSVHVAAGVESLCELAGLAQAELVLVATSGVVGLRPTFAALQAGKTVASANKESLILGGPFLKSALESGSGKLLPVDSEHCGVAQCLAAVAEPAHVRRVWLTASGGPFLHRASESFHSITPPEALRHPNWTMGPKVTLDCATLANKGLELMEAKYLFNLPAEALGVLIHPQSCVHALVEKHDGSVLAQMAPTSMLFPIQYALLYPQVKAPPEPGLSFLDRWDLSFQPPDYGRFPSLRLAQQALSSGHTAEVVFNAANEVAARAFLAECLPFTAIPDLIQRALDGYGGAALPLSLEEACALDSHVRHQVSEWVLGWAGHPLA